MVPDSYRIRLFSNNSRDSTALFVQLERTNGCNPHVALDIQGDLTRILDSDHPLKSQIVDLARALRTYSDRLLEMAPNLEAGDWK